jgi:hypothetical protein
VPRSISAARVPVLFKFIAFVIFLPEELYFGCLDFDSRVVRLVLFLPTPILLVRLTLLLASRKRHHLAATIGAVIVVIILLGFTVDLWASTWMLVGLLIGVSAHLADLGRGGNATTLMPIHPGDARTKNTGSLSGQYKSSSSWRPASSRRGLYRRGRIGFASRPPWSPRRLSPSRLLPELRRA